MLTSHVLRAIIAHEMVLRGSDVMTLTRDDVERIEDEIKLEITELAHSYILTAVDIDPADTDATDMLEDDTPGDDFPVPTPPSDLPHSH